jgi:hypothetical protein
MSARDAAPADGDWWMPHVLIALFVMLVAAMLRLVPGWSAPLHAWIALAAFVVAVLAVHAGARAIAWAMRRRWRAALLGLTLAAGLGVAAGGLMAFGRWVGVASDAAVFADPAGEAR